MNIDTHQEPKKEIKKHGAIREFIQFALLALLIVVPIRLYVAQPFIVHGESMDPTFAENDYLIVDELSYRFTNPKRGDVVILKYTYGYDAIKPYYIKRIVALPGETIEIKGQKVRIINKEHPEGFILNEPYLTHQNFPEQEIIATMSEGEYFVMGDNRTHSKDARTWGHEGMWKALKREDIIGRPMVRLWPFNNAEFFPGEFQQK